MPFKIVRNDIVRMQVDTIVNTANREPIYADGVDRAVYEAAGAEELLAARKEIGSLQEGEAAITPGFRLPAKYIIHAVSPLYVDGKQGEEKKLRSCYRNSLKLALEHQCQSIAFPLIATGSFGYPKEEGIRIALDEINAFLLRHDMMIYLVVFDTHSTRLGLQLYPELEAYIDHHYVYEKREREYGDRFYNSVRKDSPGFDAYRRERDRMERKLRRSEPGANMLSEEPVMLSEPRLSANNGYGDLSYDDFIQEAEAKIRERMEHLADTFQEYLFYLIGERGLTNADVYKRAIITKQTFSKIKKNPDYHPDKATAMRLCVGAGLSLDETRDLLARAGYALSPCDKRDIIFSFFIEQGIYDMIEIDIILEEHGLPCFIE